MKIKLNDSIIETFKNATWDKVDENRFVAGDFSVGRFIEITGLNIAALDSKLSNPYYEATYWRTEQGEEGYVYNLSLAYLTENHDAIFSCCTDDIDTDFLGLFEEKTEEEQKTMSIEDLEAAINKFTPEEVAKLIENNCTDVYDAIRDIVLDNLEVNDLPGWLQDDAGKDWVENNLDDARNKYLDSASSSDLRDLAVEIINEYL